MSLDVGLYIKVDTGGKELHEVNLYDANITHNLNKMAADEDLYDFLWAPENLDITIASGLVLGLSKGLDLLKSDPERFKKFDSPNGWGMYEHFVPFVEDYLAACEAHPKASINISK